MGKHLPDTDLIRCETGPTAEDSQEPCQKHASREAPLLGSNSTEIGKFSCSISPNFGLHA